jgi:hypothetical protein
LLGVVEADPKAKSKNATSQKKTSSKLGAIADESLLGSPPTSYGAVDTSLQCKEKRSN